MVEGIRPEGSVDRVRHNGFPVYEGQGRRVVRDRGQDLWFTLKRVKGKEGLGSD